MDREKATQIFQKTVRSCTNFFISDEILQEKMETVIAELEKIEITEETDEALLLIPVIPCDCWPLQDQLNKAEIDLGEIKLDSVHDIIETPNEPYFLIGVEIKNQKDQDLSVVVGDNEKNNLLELTLIEALSIHRACPLKHDLYTPGSEYEMDDEVMSIIKDEKYTLSSNPFAWCGPVIIQMDIATATARI